MKYRRLPSYAPLFQRYSVLLMALVLLLASNTSWAQQEVEIHELSNRPASDLVGQLRALYPDQNVVFSADGQRLMVKAPGRISSEIAQLVERLDVAPLQLRISVRHRQGSQLNSHNTTVRSTRSSQSQQSIVVQSGETARIEAGTIRRVTRAVSGGDHIGLIAEDTPMTSGFLVQPRTLGPEQVELRVVSFDKDPPRHRAQAVDRDTAAVVTMRRVAPGEWVALGSSTDSETADSGNKTYSTRQMSSSNRVWSVKVDILP